MLTWPDAFAIVGGLFVFFWGLTKLTKMFGEG